MFVSVMVIFAIYAVIFIVFEDYDRRWIEPFNEVSDWHLLGFSLVVLLGLGVLLHRYARRMDERISREQAEKVARCRLFEEVAYLRNHKRNWLVLDIDGELLTDTRYLDCLVDIGERDKEKYNEDPRDLTDAYNAA